MFLTPFSFAHARLLMSADRLVEEKLLKPSVALGFLFKTRWTGSSVFRRNTKIDFLYIILHYLVWAQSSMGRVT